MVSMPGSKPPGMRAGAAAAARQQQWLSGCVSAAAQAAPSAAPGTTKARWAQAADAKPAGPQAVFCRRFAAAAAHAKRRRAAPARRTACCGWQAPPRLHCWRRGLAPHLLSTPAAAVPASCRLLEQRGPGKKAGGNCPSCSICTPRKAANPASKSCCTAATHACAASVHSQPPLWRLSAAPP